MNPPSLSVVVIAKNEACNIRRCLESVSLCDDLVVVDDESQDATRQIAESCRARVLVHRFESFARQRNWALEHAELRYPWVLMLDADEALTPRTVDAVLRALADADPDVAGFLMCRKTWFLNRWLGHCDGFPVWIMRLVRQGRAWFLDSGHGEIPAPPVEGRLERIREPFLHYPFSKGFADWFARHNTYSTREAALEIEAPPAWSWSELLRGSGPERRRALRNLGRSLPGRPLLRFLHHYVWKLGFLDGRAGFAYSTLMAGYERMIVLKRWEMELAESGRKSLRR